ncbi:alpha/beta hydrolase [Segetibacter sp. 3557_3]|uniref:alpha/beta fold hydrolase n=1 Tax=Segetibacter sp. 3557_3 TaxID=2547429 RepID=UPI0010585618|nr:alpha/beta hydrolase [Segetibacter sp. 3557_3]TDH28712.1 alpha/beta hydrolase [Segetibacter sp. 3557_3]
MLKSVSNSMLFLLVVLFGCKTAERTSTVFRAQEGYVEAANGVRLFYRLLGARPDTLVVIHGGPGLTMDYFFDDLAPLAVNHTLLFYDQRGTGRSTLVSDSISLDAQRFAEDLEAIRKYFGIKKLALLGHSWGSAVISLYATRYPEKVDKMIIVGALPLQQHQLGEASRNLEARRDSTTLKRMRELHEKSVADPGNTAVCTALYALWFEAFYGNRNAATRSKGDFCAGTLESRRNKMSSVDRYTMASLGQWDWRSPLSKVLAPTLIIHGTADPLPQSAAQEWATVLPNGRLLLLKGVGHFPYLEVPRQFFRAVNHFLRKD